MKNGKLGPKIGSEPRNKRYELLPFPDRRGVTKPNGGQAVPVHSNEAERPAIVQSSRAYRLPGFIKPRNGRAAGRLKRRGSERRHLRDRAGAAALTKRAKQSLVQSYKREASGGEFGAVPDHFVCWRM